MTKRPEHDRNAERYENDPSLLEPGEPVGPLPERSSRLSGAVPVRFTPETIERIKDVATTEGVTVSTWIRRQVDQALDIHDRRRALMVIELKPSAGIERRLRPSGRRRLGA